MLSLEAGSNLQSPLSLSVFKVVKERIEAGDPHIIILEEVVGRIESSRWRVTTFPPRGDEMPEWILESRKSSKAISSVVRGIEHASG